MSVERIVSTRATVSGDGASPRSARSRVRKRENECSAPARSPTVARRRRRACWASSETGSSHTRRRAQTTAPAWSPASSDSAATRSYSSSSITRCSSRALVQPFLLDAGRELRVGELARLLPCGRMRSGAEARARRRTTSGASPSVVLEVTSASGPSAFRSAQTAVRRLPRALSSSTSGQRSGAIRARACSPGLSASQTRSAVALPLVGRPTRAPSRSTPTSPSRVIRIVTVPSLVECSQL